MAELPREQLEWARRWIAANRWQFAETMPTIPHSYNVRSWHVGNGVVEFQRMVDLVASYGWIEQFHGTPRAYLIIDQWKYWWIEPVLNRCRAPGIVFGEQTASRTRSNRPASRWDAIAPHWDRAGGYPFGTNTTYEEEHNLAVALEELIVGSVLDLGCGTGRLLDLLAIPPAVYLGIDPSSGMLNRHVIKHPRHRVKPLTAQEYFDTEGKRWDTITALFGAASELSKDELLSVYERDPELLWLMFGPERGEYDCLRDLPGMREVTLGRWSVLTRRAPSTLFADAPMDRI